MSFGERLIDVRKEHGYTREALAQELGISKFTLRNYELEATEPGHTFLKQISDFFNVSVDYLMELSEEKERMTSYNLKSSEFEHIKKYRTLDPHGKDMVDTVLNKESERMMELDISPAAIIDIHSHQKDTSRLVEYFHSASAGTGIFILGNETADQLAIPNTPENRKVDYAIKVSGNSMEPDYHDGDIVLVSQKVEMNIGDVGIFIINNDAYIKEYGETELISRNPEADNITIAEYDNIVCMGKVVGKYVENEK